MEGDALEAEVLKADVDKLSEEIVHDDLPLIFYGEDIPQIKDVEVVMPFDYFGKSGNKRMYCKTKAQGNSSMAYPKKNQTTKFFADADCTEKVKINFRNWGKQNKYCMKANWIDLTHARNIVSARIWGDVVRSRANFAELPELLRTSPNVGAIDGFPVLAYVDGEYHGRYTINIPKDGWMANMDDENPNHCILCGENYVSGCFRAPAKIDESDWSDELHDSVPENIKTRWNEVISFVMNSTDEDFKLNLGNYFDVLSLIDYLLFGLASCHLDGFGKNQIYLTYDGQKWLASMYDMDSTWGLYWNGTRFVDATFGRKQYEDYVTGISGNLLYHRLEQLFHEEIKERWNELAHGALSYSNIMRRFEEFIGIVPPHIVAEDYATTTGGGAFTGIPSKETNNIHQIRKFARERLAYTDGYISALPGAYVPDVSTTVTWSDNPDSNVDSLGNVVGGGNYVTNAIPVGENNCVAVRNINDASFGYLSLHNYDSSMNLIGSSLGGGGSRELEAPFVARTAYIRVTAFPGDVATNNNPDEQIEVVLRNRKWSERAVCKINSSNGVITTGGNFVSFELMGIEGGKTVHVTNANGATFRYIGIAQYDADGQFVKYDEKSGSENTVITAQNTAYLRFSAFPNGVESNNDPENQLVITVS